MDDQNHPVYYGPPPPLGLPATSPAKPLRNPPPQSPQTTITQFWQKFTTAYPGKVFAVLPSNPYARHKRRHHPSTSTKRVAKSYDVAHAECERDVERIIKECQRTNQKYRDLHFDIEWDLKSHQRNCLDGLKNGDSEMKPKGVKRVTDIFEQPQFYINGPTAGDVRQGRDGDCYLMAALCGLGNMQGLIDRVCVKHNVQVGVYGFVFYRDGEWQQTIVDDKLYLRAPDYDEALDERVVWDNITRNDSEEEYRKVHQTGSRSLYFAQCSEENETWLPLLEKAYAKAHGDYSAIDGGFTGEAVEDLTGGVTTEVYSTDILDKERFWREELMRVNKEFLFGCATGFYSNWLDTSGRPGRGDKERQGISEGHAYSIMEAREVKGKRLLKVRNPWGRKEWDGKWSDGSAEWDAEWLGLLGHKFGNDGVFWISYEDLLKKYQHFDRTRIFGKEWSVSQAWVGVDVGWSPEYHGTRFRLTVKEKGPVVIVLTQLDDTYFNGLEGCYAFDLQFRLEEEGGDPDDYLVRSNGAYAMARSVSTDIELEAGTYLVLMKITATRDPEKQPVEEVLAEYVDKRRDKVIQMGMSYDLAHAKGVYVESKQEKEHRMEKEEKAKLKDKAKMKKKMRERAEKRWRKEKMRHDREKERRMRKKKRGNVQGDADDKSREGNGSLDAQPAASAVSTEVPRDNAHHLKQNATEGHNVPLRIKSFSGQTIHVASPSTEAETVPPVPPPTSQMTKEGDSMLSQEPSQAEAPAANVVQSLDEVIKTADAETQASKPELPHLQLSTATPASETEDKPQTPIIKVNGKDAITDVKPLSTKPPLSTPEHTLPDPTAPATNGETEKTLGEGLLAQDNMDSMRGFAHPRFGMMNGVHGDADETSSMDSFPSFDWNSELDVTSEYGLDSESDEDGSSDGDDDDEGDDLNDNPDGDAEKKAEREPRRLSSSSSTNSEGDILYKPPISSRTRHLHSHHGGMRPRDDPAGMVNPGPGMMDHSGQAADGMNKQDEPAEPWNAVCVVGLRVYSKSSSGEGVGLEIIWGDELEVKKKRRRKWKGKPKGGPGKAVDAAEEAKEKGKVDEAMEPVLVSPVHKLDPDDQGKGMLHAGVEGSGAGADAGAGGEES